MFNNELNTNQTKKIYKKIEGGNRMAWLLGDERSYDDYI